MVELRSSRRDFKKGIDGDEGRRRRENHVVQLRKNKKEMGMMKRRAIGAKNTEMSDSLAIVDKTNNNSDNGIVTKQKVYTKEDLPTLMPIFTSESNNPERLLEAVRGIRKMLSVENNPPVHEVIECGALPILVGLLNMTDNDDILFEASWALTNVASTDQTKAVVENNAVPPLIALLLSKSANVREQCAWCLGNIAGDSTDLRNYVLECGGMSPLLQNIAQPENDGLLNNCVWALSNFCRGKPQPQLSLVAPALPYLAGILEKKSGDALMDACWALSYLSDGDNDRIDAVMSTGVVTHLVSFLESHNATVVTPALRTIGNFVSGSDVQTQAVLDAGVLNFMPPLLEHARKNVRKETCWLLSNVAAGTKPQISQLMNSNILGTIVDLVHDAPWDVRKEATWVVSNIATGGTDSDVQTLAGLGAIEAICSVLEANDSKITLVGLEAMENILRVGQKYGKIEQYLQNVHENDGLDILERLQEHQNEDIYEKSINIIETFFGVDDNLEDENLVPNVNGDTFSFGLPNKDMDTMEGESTQQQPLQTYNFNF